MKKRIFMNMSQKNRFRKLNTKNEYLRPPKTLTPNGKTSGIFTILFKRHSHFAIVSLHVLKNNICWDRIFFYVSVIDKNIANDCKRMFKLVFLVSLIFLIFTSWKYISFKNKSTVDFHKMKNSLLLISIFRLKFFLLGKCWRKLINF